MTGSGNKINTKNKYTCKKAEKWEDICDEQRQDVLEYGRKGKVQDFYYHT
jgi:hypothetical protein